MDELKLSGKPFEISKWVVQEAFEKVKANKGAPGVDGVAIEEFEKDLKNNLYKIWNRMSSGTYFPPPVRAVEIPKSHGAGTRFSGCPPWPTGSLRQWWRASWNGRSKRFSIRTRLATALGGLRWTRWLHAGNAAGRPTG